MRFLLNFLFYKATHHMRAHTHMAEAVNVTRHVQQCNALWPVKRQLLKENSVNDIWHLKISGKCSSCHRHTCIQMYACVWVSRGSECLRVSVCVCVRVLTQCIHMCTYRHLASRMINNFQIRFNIIDQDGHRFLSIVIIWKQIAIGS